MRANQTRRHSSLYQRQLYLGSFFVQHGAKVEGRNWVSREPTCYCPRSLKRHLFDTIYRTAKSIRARKLSLYEKVYSPVRLALAISSTAGPPSATSEAILPSSSTSIAEGVPEAPNERPTEKCWSSTTGELREPVDAGSPVSENTLLLGSSVNRGNLLLPQHVGSQLTKFLSCASAPC